MKFYEELWQQLPVPGFVIDRSDHIIEFYGQPLGIKNARKHLGWYLDGLTCSQTLRNRLLRSLNTDEIHDLIWQAVELEKSSAA